MTDTLDGKAALVTGGSRGIGAAIAQRLADAGADITLTYHHDRHRAEAVADHIRRTGRRATTLRADNADPAAVVNAVDDTAARWGRLDVLVNNAAAYLVKPLGEMGTDDIEHTVAVNIRAPFVACQAAARHLPAGGRIITIGSNMAERTVFPGMALYAMSKTALVGLTKALGRELGPRAITVNLVNPGPTDTDANPAGADHAPAVSGLTALGHYAEPADIAAAVVFLAGPGGRYITGATLNVDGGFTI